MLRKGQDPTQYDQMHEDLAEAWQPVDVMQGLLVKSIADKEWDKLQLRSAWLESQMAGLEAAQVQAERRQLLARRWLPGAQSTGGVRAGLWQAQDSSSKFAEITEILGCLQNWFENETCPDEYPDAMQALYGDCPSRAGEKIRELFMQLFEEDEAAREKARQELPQWIAQERRDVQQERELYQRERALKKKGGPKLVEEQVEAKEAALDRQIAGQTRLLLQLKSNRALERSRSEADETAPAQEKPGTRADGGEKSAATGVNGAETVACGPVVIQTASEGQTKPLDTLESST